MQDSLAQKTPMTKYACPHCDGHIKAGPAYAGKKIPCPHCATIIEIPRASALGHGSPAGVKMPMLRTHRIVNSELLGAMNQPAQWGAFRYMLVVWLVAGVAEISWLVYLNWRADFMVGMSVCLGAAWALVLTAALMVRKGRWVKAWAMVFAVVSLAAIVLIIPMILAANISINQKVPALVAGFAALAMLVVTLEAVCVKRKLPPARAKIISA